jgi:hypothetical protein
MSNVTFATYNAARNPSSIHVLCRFFADASPGMAATARR